MKTILLADDEATVRDVIKRMLAPLAGIAIESFEDGCAALSFIEGNPHRDIALVITDVQMPRCGGIALARAIRGRGLKAPIVFMSGAFDREMIAQTAAISPLLLAKPFEARELRELVSMAVM